MCGIVGYVGDRQAAEFLLDGLSKLEYRGYDSAGSLFTTTEAFVSRRALDACPHFVTRSREMSPLATSVSVIHVGRRTVVRRM